jgi:hypothetical protein
MMVKGYGFLFKLEADGGLGKGEIVMEEVNLDDDKNAEGKGKEVKNGIDRQILDHLAIIQLFLVLLMCKLSRLSLYPFRKSSLSILR